MRFRSWGALGAFAVLAALMLSVSASGADTSAAKKTYIVQMLDAPVVAYEGGTAGLKATKAGEGNKINPNSPAVQEYLGYLRGTHDKALAKVGGAKKIYDYGITFNGFAAQLTEGQAKGLEKAADVVAVNEDYKAKLDTATTPAFLGLTASGGLWEQLGGPTGGKNANGAGDGIVVGIVDSGIWPESKSFSDRDAAGKLVFQQIPGWHGKCTPGEQFTGSTCNQKLIGAQWYNSGWGGDAGIKELFPYEFLSARDVDGHGTHTASTSAGNFGVAASALNTDLGSISGMAPRARVAAYKVCWGSGGEGGCFGSDSVAAIDQAVADGVDVLNFSISGSTTSFLDPVEVAFLFAADAGVFVAASAGNSGPTASTVAHNSPWLTTVAAGTHDRAYVATATLGNSVTYTGVGLGAAVSSKPLIAASAAGKAGADAVKVSLCYSSADGGLALDPAKVAGKIVVCDRGVIARTNKSLAVKEAGGLGMILVNTSASSLNADLHFVPTVHLQNTDRAAVLAYAATAGATASLSAGVKGVGVAPDVALFSSRGPANAGGGDLLKPDIMAPGVDVLAAVSPALGGRNFDFLSGTSMSSPHMAGLGALMKQRHPSWSPAAIKSAFMTSASQTRNNGTPIPGNPFGFGAGQVTPNSAVNPGLVYDAGFNDWLGFLCGTGQLTASYCPSITIKPSDLNYPSIAIGSLVGSQTIKRTVTNVGGTAANYAASISAPVGFTVTASPSSFTIAAGAKQAYTVTITRTDAALGTYAFGSITWSDGAHSVRSPIAVRPVALRAPAEVSGTGGPLSWSVIAGYPGTLNAVTRGPVAATVTDVTVAQDPDQTFSPTDPTGTYKKDILVPAGAIFRTGIYEDAITPTGTDLDLYVYLGTALVGSSADGDSNEEVTLRLSASPLTLTVYVHGWLTNGPSANVKLFDWAATTDTGKMTVTPTSTAVTTGQTVPFSATFTGLTAATRYFGSVDYNDGTNRIGQTYVSVKTP